MAITFPTSLDSFSNPASGDLLSTGHALQHANINDAVEALEAKVAIGNTVLGKYTAYTPTFTGLTVGNATVTGSYCRVNDFVHFWGRVVLGTTSTMSAAGITMTVPVNLDATVAGNFGSTFIGQVGVRDDSASASYSGVVQAFATFANIVSLQVLNASTTYLTNAAIVTAVPMTWAVSDVLWWNFYYKAA